MAVSAEVYGQYNKKEDFVPKVIAKDPEQRSKLEARLMTAFMFSNLDEKEMAIVMDAIESVNFNQGDQVIVEGDQGDCMYVVESG